MLSERCGIGLSLGIEGPGWPTTTTSAPIVHSSSKSDLVFLIHERSSQPVSPSAVFLDAA